MPFIPHLRAMRTLRHWSRAPLAQKRGVSVVPVSRLESLREIPHAPSATVVKLARAFALAEEELKQGASIRLRDK